MTTSSAPPSSNARSLRLAMAAVLGAVHVACFAPLEQFYLAPLVFAALFRLWHHASAREAALIGFSFGLGWFGTGVSWIYISLHTFGAMPSLLAGLATLLFCAYLALHPALAGYLSRRFTLGPAVHWILFVPATFMLLEWLRGWLWTGFPWLNPGYSQVPVSPLAGYAPVLGVHGVTLLLFITAGALSRLFADAPSGRWRNLMPWLATISMVWIGGAALKNTAWTEPTGSRLSVSLLQGNIAQDVKWRDDHLRATFRTYGDLVQSSRAQLIVLPETALPLFQSDVPADFLDALARHAHTQGGDLLLGVPERSSDGRYYNSVVSLGRSTRQSYRKNHLVPFGEFIPIRPLLGTLVSALSIPLQDFSRGDREQRPLQVAGEAIAVNICYEDAFGEEIIRQLPEATILVNVSNVAWFGRSMAPRQHLQIAQMRALETGRYMLRATNTGMTAVIDPGGQIQAQAPEFTRSVLTHTVSGMAGATPYVRWGNTMALSAAALMLMVGFASRRKYLAHSPA
jgi:apolipoprotein N-acyltransferase